MGLSFRTACTTALIALTAQAAPARPPVSPAQGMRPALPARAVFPFGVAWYPEWYGEAEWSKDLDRMKQANVSFVRIAEFAWARMEPSEGHYDTRAQSVPLSIAAHTLARR